MINNLSLDQLESDLTSVQQQIKKTMIEGRKKSFSMSRARSKMLRDNFNKLSEREVEIKAQIEAHEDYILSIDPCDCGEMPGIKKVLGSEFGLRVIGCENCYTTGPARLNDIDAISQWNIGHRINPKGFRICKCCT